KEGDADGAGVAHAVEGHGVLVEVHAGDHGGIAGAAVGEEELGLEALQAADDAEDDEELDLAHEEREVDGAEAGEAGGAVDAGGVEDVGGDVLEAGVVEEEGEPADPGEADEDEGVQRLGGVAEPGALQEAEADGAQELVQEAELVVVDEAPDEQDHHA